MSICFEVNDTSMLQSVFQTIQYHSLDLQSRIRLKHNGWSIAWINKLHVYVREYKSLYKHRIFA